MGKNVTQGTTDAWTSDAYTLGCIAQLMAAIQQHLFQSKEITRMLLQTGAWESFLRTLQIEIDFTRRSCRNRLREYGTAQLTADQLQAMEAPRRLSYRLRSTMPYCTPTPLHSVLCRRSSDDDDRRTIQRTARQHS